MRNTKRDEREGEREIGTDRRSRRRAEPPPECARNSARVRGPESGDRSAAPVCRWERASLGAGACLWPTAARRDDGGSVKHGRSIRNPPPRPAASRYTWLFNAVGNCAVAASHPLGTPGGAFLARELGSSNSEYPRCASYRFVAIGRPGTCFSCRSVSEHRGGVGLEAPRSTCCTLPQKLNLRESRWRSAHTPLLRSVARPSSAWWQVHPWQPGRRLQLPHWRPASVAKGTGVVGHARVPHAPA